MIGIKNIFLFALFCFCQKNLWAQTQTSKKIDSLLILIKAAKEDTNKVNTLNELSKQISITGDNKTAIKYANDALSLAQKTGFKKGIAVAYNYIGIIQKELYRYDEAMTNYFMSLKISEEIGFKENAGSTYLQIGNVYKAKGKYQEALDNYNASLKIMNEIKDKHGIALCYNNIGTICNIQDKYAEAVINHEAALKIRKEIGDRHGIASSYGNIGICYQNLDNFTEALKNFKAALAIFEELGAKQAISTLYNRIGLIYDSRGNYPEALKNILASLKIKEQIGDKKGILAAKTNIGLIYNRQGNYKEALKCYEAALNIAEETGDKSGLSVSYANIGDSYRQQKKYDVAMKYYLKALNIAEEIGEKRRMGIFYSDIGNLYKDQGNYPEAQNNFSTALKINLELGSKGGIAGNYLSIADAIFKEASFENMIVAKQKYTEAIRYLNKAILIANEIGVKENIRDAYKIMTEIYAGSKDYEKALEYNGLYVALKDSLMNNEATQKLEKLRTQYEVEKAIVEEKAQQEKILAEKNVSHALELAEEKLKKEKAIEVEKLKYEFALAEEITEQDKILAEQRFLGEKKLTEENARHQQAMTEQKALQEKEKAERKRKNEWLLTGLAIVGIISFFLVLLRHQRNLKRRAIEKSDTAHKMSELELQSLRAQLNPHFMFNSLNAIQDLIVHEENDRSHLYLSRFSKLLRLLLDNANHPFVTIKQELDFLELYLSLENLRIPDLQFTIEKDPAINTGERMIPNMMLQPYIENAIWHGLSHKDGNRKLQIRIHENGNATEFEIEDNGVGRKKAAEMKSLFRKGHTSKGMELLSKRFILLSKEYGAAIQTTITDLHNNGDATGTLVKIDVPFSLSEQTKQTAHDTNHYN